MRKSYFSLLFAFFIEQVHPLPVGTVVWRPLRSYASVWENLFNDGDPRHGAIAWWVAVSLPVLASLLVYYLFLAWNPLLAFGLNVVVLYLTTGFRQFSHHFSAILEALRGEDLPLARERLREWRGGQTDLLSSEEVARLTIEEAILACHRHVFGVAFLFVLLPGPSGAVLYRVADFLARRWGSRRDPEFGQFGEFARRAFAVLDWVPVRLTALSFAVVGNFEDAVHCWREQAREWPEKPSGILLASGAGALGVRLGAPVRDGMDVLDRPELGTGVEAGADIMESAVGLVWRTLLMCMLLLGLMGLANWVGQLVQA